MTQYACDRRRRALVAIWSTGDGDLAETVADLPEKIALQNALRLSGALTVLSQAMWRTYTHPPAAADSLAPNTEGWRRELTRGAFDNVILAIRHPNLPREGMLRQSYDPVEESGHRVGRVLHDIADSSLTELVAADVDKEISAIDQAERGDLSGRAQQAVKLTRAAASPAQVAAADALFQEDPLGSERLFTEVDATAACVAAAHWLQAAAVVAAQGANLDPSQVIVEADNIEALAVRTPTLVLERLNSGETPYEVVEELVRAAMMVAEGRIPSLSQLLDQVTEADEKAEEYGERADEMRDVLIPDRITPLDPLRPAPDLLEDLLDGIHGCWILYRENVDEEEEQASEEHDLFRADQDSFLASVRRQALSTRDRIL